MTEPNWYQHEALDRTHVAICTIDDHIYNHPFIEQHQEIRAVIEQALELLASAYQMIGAKGD